MELSMTEMRLDLALERVLDALEAELLAAPEEEIRAAVAETGMKAGALVADPERAFELMNALPPGDKTLGQRRMGRAERNPSSSALKDGFRYALPILQKPKP
jgi:hypothetical protein